MRLVGSLHLVFVLAMTYTTAAAQDVSLEATLDGLVKNGKVVAAQAVVGRGDRIAVNHVVGVTIPGGDRDVNTDTLFCIGSCSKPFASAVVMSIVEDGSLDLEQPIDRYLPAFAGLQLPDNMPVERAPSMKELLTHRSGIYSQRKRLTQRQVDWIRNFRRTLEDAVNGIAGESLISPPGTEYAYSGAGYCVAGRVAEVVTGESFEKNFQSRLAAPLKLQRTTFFPHENDSNVAAGGSDGQANPNTPHRIRPLRFALIGGSLYSTAQETARFLQMTAQHGKLDGVDVLKPDTWTTWTSRPYSKGTYGFGWALTSQQPDAKPERLSHSGSLASSRSTIRVDLQSGAYAVVHYTVTNRDPAVGQQIMRAMDRAMSVRTPARQD